MNNPITLYSSSAVTKPAHRAQRAALTPYQGTAAVRAGRATRRPPLQELDVLSWIKRRLTCMLPQC